MKEIIFVLVVFLAALVQCTLLEGVKLFTVKPDLLFVCVFVAAAFLERSWSLCIAVICGLLQDVLGSAPVAMHVVLMPCASWVFGQVSRRTPLDNPLVGAVVLLLTLFAYNVVVSMLLGVVSLRVLLVQPLYSAVIFLLAAGRLAPLLRR